MGVREDEWDGRQYVSWIHGVDFVRAVRWLIEHEREGAVNLAAPGPRPNRESMCGLPRAGGKRVGLPATRWMLQATAMVLGKETELILKSQREAPGRRLAAGFAFQFREWGGAAADLCRRWRERQ